MHLFLLKNAVKPGSHRQSLDTWKWFHSSQELGKICKEEDKKIAKNLQVAENLKSPGTRSGPDCTRWITYYFFSQSVDEHDTQIVQFVVFPLKMKKLGIKRHKRSDCITTYHHDDGNSDKRIRIVVINGGMSSNSIELECVALCDTRRGNLRSEWVIWAISGTTGRRTIKIYVLESSLWAGVCSLANLNFTIW